MADFLKDYSQLPDELMNAAISRAVITPGGCNADTSDCSKDSCSSDDGSSGCTNDTKLDPPTAAGTLTLISRTSTSVSLRLKSIPKATYYVTVYRKTSESVAPSSNYAETTSLSWTVYSLSPNTSYVFNYRGFNDDGAGPYMSPGLTVTTLPEVTAFDWTYAGLDDDGSIVYGPEKLSGYNGMYVSADEWNELADLVSEKTGKYVEKVSPGTLISAYIVNTMASALGVSRVYSEETVITGDFFNKLRSAYNNLE